jgi:hypothetical protein
MLGAARDALLFTEGRRREDLDSDRMLVLALVKSVEMVGEAGGFQTTAEPRPLMSRGARSSLRGTVLSPPATT